MHGVTATEHGANPMKLTPKHPPMRSRWQRWQLRIASVALGLALAPAMVHADASVAIVFDGSGSMWGKASAGNKFTAARNALRDALATAPETAKAGLYGFGLRRRGNCGRVEAPIAVADGTAATVTEALDRLNPQGRGPIAQAIEAAGSALKDLPAPRAIVLIHDDNDNCKADPCAVALSLKADMPDLKIHAVTLRDAVPVPLMACFTEITGGQVAQSLDVATVSDETAKIIRAAFATAPTPPRPEQAANQTPESTAEVAERVPSAGVTQVDGRTGLSISANLAASGPRYDAPIDWTITPKAGDDPIVKRVSGLATLALKTGSYTVTASVGGISIAQDLTIADGKETRFIADLDAADLSFEAKLGTDGDRVGDAAVELRRTDATSNATDTAIRFTTTRGTPMLIPAGTYEATARKGMLGETVELNVIAGAAQPVGFQLPGAKLTVKLTDLPPGFDAREAALIEVYAADANFNAGARPIAQSLGGAGEFFVTPGSYVLAATAAGTETRRTISVSQGQSLDISLPLRAGTVQFDTKPSEREAALSQGVAYSVASLDGQFSGERHLFDATPTISLVAGRYRVTSRILGIDQSTSRQFSVAPGQKQSITVVHGVGKLRLIYVIPANRSLAAPQVDWDVRRGDVNGQAVWRGLGREIDALLPAGRYSVIANGQSKLAKTVEVVAGQQTAVTIDAQPRRAQ